MTAFFAMKPSINKFLKAQTADIEFHVAFFSNPGLPEEICSYNSNSYTVILDHTSSDCIQLKVDESRMMFTATQAAVLGEKLIELSRSPLSPAPDGALSRLSYPESL